MVFNLAEDGSYGDPVLRGVAGVESVQAVWAEVPTVTVIASDAKKSFSPPKGRMFCFDTLEMTGALVSLQSQSANTTSRSRGSIRPRLAIEFP
jgi:hypothetical protein